MEIKEAHAGNALILRLVGRLDVSTATIFDARLKRAGSDENRLVIDCSQLEYISSAGLRVFLVIGKRLKLVDGKMAVFGLSSSVRATFDQTGFSTLLPIFTDEATAVQSVG